MILRCPICQHELFKNDSRYICIKNHSFDIASSGYASLLIGNKKHTGDDKLMSKSRRDFFNHDYYQTLKNKLVEIIAGYDIKTLVDAGCGEGYYTNYIKDKLNIDIYAFDMSKYAINYASKRSNGVHYFVSSIFDMPLVDKSVDMILSIFAPIAHEEFKRVLKDNGYFIKISPLERHLWELKVALYDKPYENVLKKEKNVDFIKIDEIRVKDKIIIDNNEDIRALFTMTPYYYRSSKSTFEKLNKLDKLDISLEFRVEIFKKI